jgi:hypothetical protein
MAMADLSAFVCVTGDVMKRHIFLFPLLLPVLAGCSSVRGLLAFEDQTPPAAAEMDAAPADVAPAAAPADSMAQWCQRVAATARRDAAASGFDSATQERLAAQNYRQCLAMGTAG